MLTEALALVSLLLRIVAVVLALCIALLFWRVSRRNGLLIKRLGEFFTCNALAMAWYVIANLLSRYGLGEWGRLLVLWGWVIWLPLLVTLVRLWRALGR